MIRNTPILSTDRLILKRGLKGDYEKVYEYNFLKLRDICGEFEFEKTNLKDIEGFEKIADQVDEFYDWIVFLNDTNEPIGNVTADCYDENLNSIELAFNLHPNYWGCGYMKEAVIAIMEYLFSNGYDNILCGYSSGNIKSKKLGEKIGFEYFKKIENAWIKNNQPIDDYKTIMTKDRFYELYKGKLK